MLTRQQIIERVYRIFPDGNTVDGDIRGIAELIADAANAPEGPDAPRTPGREAAERFIQPGQARNGVVPVYNACAGGILCVGGDESTAGALRRSLAALIDKEREDAAAERDVEWQKHLDYPGLADHRTLPETPTLQSVSAFVRQRDRRNGVLAERDGCIHTVRATADRYDRQPELAANLKPGDLLRTVAEGLRGR